MTSFGRIGLLLPLLIPSVVHAADAVYTFTTLAGAPSSLAATEPLDSPYDVAADVAGNVYIADSANHVIRKLAPNGELTVLAGVLSTRGSNDGPLASARFDYPTGLTVDRNGNVFVSDSFNSTIRRISPAGDVTTIAGQAGVDGSTDGPGTSARFDNPEGIAVDDAGSVYVADSFNHVVRKITPAGVVSTLAGSAGMEGTVDGTGPAARFDFPDGVAVDLSGNVYVADARNCAIRRITPAGVVTTLAGSKGNCDSTDGRGTAARFDFPRDVVIDPSGVLYVSDQQNETIRRVTTAGDVTTFAGSVGVSGTADGVGTAARFNEPWGLGVDGAGNIYVADRANDGIRKITPQALVSTLGTHASRKGSVDGAGSSARFNRPTGIAVDRLGNTYVADTNNHTIRKISPGGEVTTFAGSPNLHGDSNGTGSAARFYYPTDVAVDTAGNVYVADELNGEIRKITPAGQVSTYASNGFSFPTGVATDSLGNVYVANSGHHTIRLIRPTGEVTTLAGLAGSRGEANGFRTDARFDSPNDIAVDSQGSVFVADRFNRAIRKIDPSGEVTTFAGVIGQSGHVDGKGSNARFQAPYGIAIDDDDTLYVTDGASDVIRKITKTGDVTTIAGLAFAAGHIDGIGVSARFDSPASIAVGAGGTLYVADQGNDAIRVGVSFVPGPRRRAVRR